MTVGRNVLFMLVSWVAHETLLIGRTTFVTSLSVKFCSSGGQDLAVEQW